MQSQQIVAPGAEPEITSLHLFDQISDALLTQGFAVIPDALPTQMTSELYRYYRQLNASIFEEAGIGRKQQYHQNGRIRTDKVCWIDGTSETGRLWLDWLEMLKVHLNRRLFLGLFSIESHFAYYQKGDFYKRHLDAFRGESNRVVSLVTYLNPDWADSDGGELILYRDDNDKSGIKVLPRLGTLVIFLSEEFPHEVRPASKDRFSVASWFRINTSTADKIDPPR